MIIFIYSKLSFAVIYPISIKTILRNFWKRFVFTLIFLSIPVIFSTILPGCNPGNPELEIIGQEIIVLEEGSYSDVLIYVAYTLKELSDNFPFYKEFGSGNLYATSPAPPNVITLITDLNITSTTAYNADYPAGSELLPLFQIGLYNDSDENEAFPIKIGENRGIFLFLKIPPDTVIQASFEITTTLNNGRTFTSLSEPLQINE